MNKLFDKCFCNFAFLKEFSKRRIVLFFSILLLFSLLIFSTFSFASRDLFNYINIGLVALLSILIVVYQLIYEKIYITSFCVLLVCFCSAILISTLLNGRLLNLSKTVFLISLMSLIVFQFAKNKNVTQLLLFGFLVGGTMFCVYYIVHYWSDIIQFSALTINDRIGDYFDNQNGVARNFVFLGIIATYFSIKTKKYYGLIYSVLMFVLIATTGSISNLLSYLIVLLFIPFVFFGKKGKIVTAIVIVLTAGIMLLLLQIPSLSYFKNRLINIFSTFFGNSGSQIDFSARDRFEYAVDAFKLFASRPLFGYGPGGVISFSSGGYAHNNFAELLADYGLIGFIFFEVIIIKLLCFSYNKKKDNFSLCVFGIALYIFIFQFFLVTFNIKIDYIIFAVLFGHIETNKSGIFEFSFDKTSKKIILAFNEISLFDKCDMSDTNHYLINI